MKLSKKKSFRVINGKPCGERSPYWEWLRAHRPSGVKHDDETVSEPPDANPDVLPEKAGMFTLNLDEQDQNKLDAVMNAWNSLSVRERQAIEWYGHEGYTLEQTASLMRISVSGVRSYLIRASQKIKKEYEKISE